LNDYFHLKTCPNGLGFAPAWWYPIVFGFAFIFIDLYSTYILFHKYIPYIFGDSLIHMNLDASNKELLVFVNTKIIEYLS